MNAKRTWKQTYHTRVHWEDIKREFIKGVYIDGNLIFLTLKELADKHHCTYSSLTKKSSAGKWLTQRNIYRGNLHNIREFYNYAEISEQRNKISYIKWFEGLNRNPRASELAFKLNILKKEKEKQIELKALRSVLSKAIHEKPEPVKQEWLVGFGAIFNK